ncbi:MAG: LysM peptidoglycan-binding domain-containing protein [Lachnospiraceae bacterium]|nr:LysM peptidoglycan-binding domain-containing protein [Lachnospiraceae bacterium]
MEEKRKLPKNVCQMGEPEPALRVYLEDYVNVFLKKAVAEDVSSVGTFLGKTCEIDGIPHVFVHGAMVWDGAVAPGGAIRVDEHLRESMEQAAEKCFPEDQVIGWFLSGDAGNELDHYQHQKLKRQILTAHDTLFCVNNAEDRVFYRMTDEDCRPLKGYYIYYEKNQNMQEYMLVCSLSKKVEPQHEATAQVVRQVLEERKEENRRRYSGRFAYGLCAVLTVFLAAAGAVILNGRLERVGSLEPAETGEAVGVGAEGKNGGLMIYEVDGQVYPTEAETSKIPQETSAETPEAETQTEATEATETPSSASETTATSAENGYTLYVVNPGEGLAAIARARYGYANAAVIAEICELNGLTDANMIQAGQQIKLPVK